MKYGLQLYSVRDAAKDSVENMLSRVAKMGYSMVESAGFYDLTAAELKALLQKNGLTLCSTHTSVRRLTEELDETIAYHKEVGCSNIVIPGTKIDTKEQVDALVDLINSIQPKIEAAGMKLHFHNHSKEWLPNSDGIITQDELASRTKVCFEIDTFWAFNAGRDPLEMLDKYADRVSIIHLKDGIPASGDTAAIGKALGEGKAPVLAVRQKAIEMGLTVVVESEGLDPCGLDEVERCSKFLNSLEK